MPCPICGAKPLNCDCTTKERKQYEQLEEQEEQLEEQAAEIERLRAIVDKLPKTADGVPYMPNTPVALWYVASDGNAYCRVPCSFQDIRSMYATRNAAVAAERERL
jgi:hypothetical protein